MNKKFLSAILFGALMVGSTGTFTSCKDYDDDIKDLQGQLDKKASLAELNSKVSALEAAINGAKTDVYKRQVHHRLFSRSSSIIIDNIFCKVTSFLFIPK